MSSPKAAYTSEQPKPGDRILACPHFDPPHQIPDAMHWFSPEAAGGPRGGYNVTRSGGKKIKVHWLVLCGACFQTHAKAPIRGVGHDFVWRPRYPGPIIERPSVQ
jgi:hypothetical protein